jgi:outer membrane lipoprotein
MATLIHLRVTAGLLATLLLVSCASSVPQQIRRAPPDNPALQEVLADSSGHAGRQVRWGGVIVETENQSSSTTVTLLALPLGSTGRPKIGDDSPGRFMAIVPTFLDPTLYSENRRMTVSGTLSGSETRKVGEFPYRYPVVEVQQYYLWPVDLPLPPRYRGPWWYDPWWYDPWYDYGYPYRPAHRY